MSHSVGTRALLAVLLAVLMVGSTFGSVPIAAKTTDGGTTSVSAAGGAPSIELANATINDSTDSTIQVAYNATGVVETNDTKITVFGPGYSARSNSTATYNVESNVTAAEDVLNVTVPAGTFGGGNVTLAASMVNESTGETEARDTAALSVTSPVDLDGYTVSATTTYPDETETVSTTLNNTADTSETYTLAVYGNSPYPRNSTQVTLTAGESRTIGLNVSFKDTGQYDIRVNDEPTTTVSVEDPVTVTNTTVSETSLHTYQNVTVNATVKNRGSSTEDRYISLYDGDRRLDTKSVSLTAGETKNLSYVTYFRYDGDVDLRVGDGNITTVSVATNPVEVRNTSVNATSVSVGDTVRTNVSLENTGSSSAERVTELRSGFRTLATSTATVAGGETATVEFNRTLNVGGAHAISAGARNYRKVSVNDPDITVDDVSVSATEVYEGDPLAVDVTLSNTGSTDRSFKLSAWSNRTSYRGEKTVRVNASETKQVSLDVRLYRTGDHTLTINDQTGTTVTVKQAVSMTNVSLSSREIGVGETATVDITLDNPTSTDREEYVSVWNGTSQSKRVTVAANSQKTVSFSVSYDETGRKSLWVNGQRETLFVMGDTTGTANVSLSRTFSPEMTVNDSSTYFLAEAVNTGDASGIQNVTLNVDGKVVDSYQVYVDPDESSFVFLEHRFTETGNHTVYINGSESKKFEVEVRGDVVNDSSVTVEHVSGTAPDQLPSVDAEFRGGSIGVEFRDPNGGIELDDIGADNSTVFRVSFRVENYTPRVLLSTGRDLTWNTTDVGGNETKVTLEVSPSDLNYKSEFAGNRPNNAAEWESAVKNDSANVELESAVLMAVGNAEGDFFDAQPSDLDGMTLSTNAQLFEMPRYYSGDADTESRLEISLAAPHKTVNGNVHQGYYRTFIPDSLLDAWNVTDPETELQATYSASDVSMSVNEVEGGAYVSLSLHYSSGTVSISKSVDDSTGSTDTTDSTSSTDATDDGTDDDTGTTDTATATATPTETAATTPTEVSTTTPTETGTTTRTRTPTVTERTDVATGSPTGTATAAETSTSGPGFGAAITVSTLVGIALVARRYGRVR